VWGFDASGQRGENSSNNSLPCCPHQLMDRSLRWQFNHKTLLLMREISEIQNTICYENGGGLLENYFHKNDYEIYF